jgi:LacI family transcriptional regulator
VARVAGVSISTVSRVLNNKIGGVHISPATRERVQAAARQLQYRPNVWARSLRTAQTKTIGVIAFDLSHPFAAELLRVISATCRARGYHLLVGTAEHDSEEGWLLSDLLNADRVDGIILIGDTLLHSSGQEQHVGEAMARLVAVHQHVVTVVSHPSLAGEAAIMVDNIAGVTLALAHLVGLGHRRIAHIRDGYHQDSWEDDQRGRAYRDFLAAHDLPYDADLVVKLGSRGLQAAQYALAGLRALPAPPTALFVNNDVAAITMLKAALLAGIRVPEELSIIGFDDIAYSALCTPGLTTVRQPVDRMGNHAANVLLDIIDGMLPGDAADPPEKTVVFAPTLVQRESCAPPP